MESTVPRPSLFSLNPLDGAAGTWVTEIHSWLNPKTYITRLFEDLSGKNLFEQILIIIPNNWQRTIGNKLKENICRS